MIENDKFHLRKLSILLICIIFVIYLYSASSRRRFVYLRNNLIIEIENSSNKSYNIPMPCIEPHCQIECVETYHSNHLESLTKFEKEHLMIDLGQDRIVQQLIQSIPPPKSCSFQQFPNEKVKLYPILFGFVDKYLPKSRIREILLNNNEIKRVEQMCLPRKSKDFSDLLPGELETYKFSFSNELDYRRLYGSAYFGITKKKGGWDCNRHYEIITSGTMPFFDHLNQSGQSTLALLPKSILYEAQNLQGIDRQKRTIDWKLFPIDEYYLLLHRLLFYSKHRLTTLKIVEYILQVVGYQSKEQQDSILFLSHYEADYLKDFALHGFTQRFGKDVHVFQSPRYLYEYPSDRMWTEEETKAFYQHRLYGFGYGYKLSLHDYFHLYERDRRENSNESSIEMNIRMKKYSLIVFGSILRQNRFYSLVKQFYQQSQVILLDGEDEGRDQRRQHFLQWGMYFLREIPDDCNKIL